MFASFLLALLTTVGGEIYESVTDLKSETGNKQ